MRGKGVREVMNPQRSDGTMDSMENKKPETCPFCGRDTASDLPIGDEVEIRRLGYYVIVCVPDPGETQHVQHRFYTSVDR